MWFHYGTRNSFIKGLKLRGLDIGFELNALEYYSVTNWNFDAFE